MRQEQITKTYLKFNELTKKQQDQVVDKLRDINTDFNWFEYSVEQFEAKLTKLGFYDIKTEFSGFYSQGDGASFTAKHKRGVIYKGGYHLYSHSGTMLCDESKALLLVAKRLANKLYSELNSEYDYYQSNAAIIETIEANDYEFDQDTLKLA